MGGQHGSVRGAFAWSHTVSGGKIGPQMPAQKYAEKNGLTAMLATKRSAGHIIVTLEVNLREHVHLCLVWVAITRSPKQRYHWPHKKELCPPKCFWKERMWKYEIMLNFEHLEVKDKKLSQKIWKKFTQKNEIILHTHAKSLWKKVKCK